MTQLNDEDLIDVRCYNTLFRQEIVIHNNIDEIVDSRNIIRNEFCLQQLSNRDSIIYAKLIHSVYSSVEYKYIDDTKVLCIISVSSNSPAYTKVQSMLLVLNRLARVLNHFSSYPIGITISKKEEAVMVNVFKRYKRDVT